MELTTGSIQSILDGEHISNPILKVVTFKAMQAPSNAAPRYRLNLTDGVTNHTYVMLGIQLNDIIDSGKLKQDSIIKLDNYISKIQADKKIIVLLDLTILDGTNNNNNNDKGLAPVTVPSIVIQPPPVNPRINTGIITPISHINSYQNRWTIEGRVSQKSAIKTWSNSKSEGKLFNFVLCDSSCDVKIVAFTNEVVKFFDMIQLGKTYTITKGVVKAANPKFNNTKCDFEIQLSSDTDVCEIEDKMDLPKMKFEFVPINQISDRPVESFVDIVGIAHTIMDVSIIVNKTTNRESTKRDVVLVDRSGGSIRLTLWSDDVKLMDDVNNPVVVVKGAHVKEFNGRTLSCVGSSTVLVNPSDIPEAMSLVGWYSEGGSSMNFQGQQGTMGGMQVPTKLATISELSCGDGTDKSEYFSVSCAISQFRRERIVYKACLTEKCNKKLVDLGNGLYKCERCETEGSDFAYRLILSMSLVDYTGTHWVTAFQEVGQLVLGKTADEIGSMTELEQKEELECMFEEALYKEFDFKLKVKNDTYNDETRMKVTVMDAKEINVLETIDRLLSQITVS